MMTEHKAPHPKADLSPDSFWSALRKALRGGPGDKSRWEAYRSDTAWTRVAIQSAEEACAKFVRFTQAEYMKLDLIGYDRRERQGGEFAGHNWDMRVAFEHENGGAWRDELCKLTHVVAELCVLVSYYDESSAIQQALQQAVDVMGVRMTRVKWRQWLFVFGPNHHAYAETPPPAFLAFSLDRLGKVVPLDDPGKLRPTDWDKA